MRTEVTIFCVGYALGMLVGISMAANVLVEEEPTKQSLAPLMVPDPWSQMTKYGEEYHLLDNMEMWWYDGKEWIQLTKRVEGTILDPMLRYEGPR